MPVWRDAWGDEPRIVVIAPAPPSGGRLRNAIVLLSDPHTEAEVTLTDANQHPLRVRLPASVLGGDFLTGETCCTLPVLESP